MVGRALVLQLGRIRANTFYCSKLSTFALAMSQETYSLRSGSAEREADRYVSRQ